MDSSKDFAKSKRKATQRHTPGRGGRGFPGSKRSSAKAELGSNVERYEDEAEATKSAGPGAVTQRSQGADLTSLLQEQQTEFRQRGTFYDDVQPLPTADGDPSLLDLSIDLQALAASLSNLPVWDVLDLDVALCKTFQSKTEPSIHQSADITKRSTLSLPAEGIAMQPSSAKHPTSATAVQTLPEHDPVTDKPAESTSETAASPSVKATPSLAPAAETVAQARSHRAEQVMSQQASAAQHSASSLQCDGQALKTDSDDLDALLNAINLTNMPQRASASVSKPAKEEQDSLEDWLNSL